MDDEDSSTRRTTLGRRGRGAVRGGGALAAVGPVEAGALEDDADGAVDLAHGAPHSGHSVTGASLKDCTTSNSCLPSGLVQAYSYVGTAVAPWWCGRLVAGLALAPGDCQ